MPKRRVISEFRGDRHSKASVEVLAQVEGAKIFENQAASMRLKIFGHATFF